MVDFNWIGTSMQMLLVSYERPLGHSPSISDNKLKYSNLIRRTRFIVEYVSRDDINALNEEDKLTEFRMNREISRIYIEMIGAKSDNYVAKTASLAKSVNKTFKSVWHL